MDIRSQTSRFEKTTYNDDVDLHEQGSEARQSIEHTSTPRKADEIVQRAAVQRDRVNTHHRRVKDTVHAMPLTKDESVRRDIILALGRALGDFGAPPLRCHAILNTVARKLHIPAHVIRHQERYKPKRGLQLAYLSDQGELHESFLSCERSVDLGRLRKIHHIWHAAVAGELPLLEAALRLEAMSKRHALKRIWVNTFVLVRAPQVAYHYYRLELRPNLQLERSEPIAA